ncbi:MAG: hypothetical protein LBB61_00745 [Treponema sp.]|nr:hypothetical protein [Treponema sp.]
MNAQTAVPPADEPGTEALVDLDSLGDIDSLFEEKAPASDTSAFSETPAEKPVVQPKPPAVPSASVISSLKKKGFSLNASYSFTGGVFPGWDEAPWYWDEYPEEQTFLPGLIMTSSMGLNYQLSDTLGVRSTFTFSFPGFAIAVDSFYLDYSVNDSFFLRAGKFSYNWGISRDFPFANLLSLVPTSSQLGVGTFYVQTDKDGNIKKIERYTHSGKNDTYTARLSIPIGIGGLEFVAIARDDFFNETNMKTNIQRELIYWGGKYNFAFKKADINAGFMYSEVMPLRVVLSVKTTLLNTELYAEGLAALGSGDLVVAREVTKWVDSAGKEQTTPWTEYKRERKWDAHAFSGSIGFARDFFSKKLTVGSEFFYNGESDLQWRTEADIEKGLTEPTYRGLIKGSNLAVNLSFKPGWRDLRFAVKFLYGIDDNTMELVPGIRIVPFPNMAVSLAVPMALGSRDGYYYRHNTDTKNRPFSIALAVTFSGSHRWDNYK